MLMIKYFGLFVCLLFFSCKEKTIRDSIIIDPSNFVEDELNISNFVDSIKYVKLSSDVIFGHIYHLEYLDEFVLIGTDQGLLLFDDNGGYIRKIGNRGNGPMEYQYCHDFTVNRKDGTIFVSDRPYIKVFSFDGECLNYIKVSGNHIKTVYKDGLLYLFPLIVASSRPTAYFWESIDLNGNLTGVKENTTVKFDGEGMTYVGNFTYKSNDFVFYWNHYSDTVFRINGTDYSSAFIWSEGSYRLTPAKNVNEEDQNCLRIRTLFETEKLLYIYYRKDKDTYICVYDKDSELFISSKMLKESKHGIKNDIDGGMPFMPQYLAAVNDEEYFIECVYPDEFLAYNQATGKDVYENINPYDNHILVVAKLKHNMR
jgi:hypothetical protein